MSFSDFLAVVATFRPEPVHCLHIFLYLLLSTGTFHAKIFRVGGIQVQKELYYNCTVQAVKDISMPQTQVH